jgi:hypothetical protein
MSDITGGDPAKYNSTEPRAKPQAQAKSDLKILEELKESAKPVPEIRAGGSQPPDPYDLASAIVDQEYFAGRCGRSSQTRPQDPHTNQERILSRVRL